MAQNKPNACKLSLERQLNSPKLYRTLSKGYSQKLLKQLNEFRKNGQVDGKQKSIFLKTPLNFHFLSVH